MSTAEGADNAGPADETSDNLPPLSTGRPALGNGRGKGPAHIPLQSHSAFLPRNAFARSGALAQLQKVHMTKSMQVLEEKNPQRAAAIEEKILNPNKHRAMTAASDRKWYEFFDSEIPAGERGNQITIAAKRKILQVRRKSQLVLAMHNVNQHADSSATSQTSSSVTNNCKEDGDSSLAKETEENLQPDLNNLDEHDKFVSPKIITEVATLYIQVLLHPEHLLCYMCCCGVGRCTWHSLADFSVLRTFL